MGIDMKTPRAEIERDYDEAKRYEIAYSILAGIFLLPVFWLYPQSVTRTQDVYLFLTVIAILASLVFGSGSAFYWWKSRAAKRQLRQPAGDP